MATFDYTEMQAVAEELIAEFGQQGAVTRYVAPDPVNGGDPVATPYTATLIPLAYNARDIDGTNILSGDVQIYISSFGLAIVPATGDFVATADGKTYRVVSNDPNNYDGLTNVVHIVQGRIAG